MGIIAKIHLLEGLLFNFCIPGSNQVAKTAAGGSGREPRFLAETKQSWAVFHS